MRILESADIAYRSSASTGYRVVDIDIVINIRIHIVEYGILQYGIIQDVVV